MLHPDVFVPDKKEVHYFTNSINEWPLSYYSFLFSQAKNQIRGEICPGYNVLQESRIRLIAKLMPEVRLFLIIRNPIDQAWSAARRQLSKHAERLGKRFDEIDDADFYRFFRKGYPDGSDLRGVVPGMRQTHYCRTIDNWLKHFEREQLLVLFFDEIRTSPKEFLTRICKHIGVRSDFNWDVQSLSVPVNQNPTHPLPEYYRAFLEELYHEEMKELEARFGNLVLSWRARGSPNNANISKLT